MTTVIEWSTRGEGDTPLVRSVRTPDLKVGDVVTNLGLVRSVSRVGVFVVAAIAGTVWSLASGTGDVHLLDVVWHESQEITVDQL